MMGPENVEVSPLTRADGRTLSAKPSTKRSPTLPCPLWGTQAASMCRGPRKAPVERRAGFLGRCCGTLLAVPQ
jgi:hypothetical protein